jgi:hypothetical protein
MLFIRLQNPFKRGEDGGKIFCRLRDSRLLGRRGWFFLFHANSLQMNFWAVASITDRKAKRFESADLSELAGCR